MDTDAVRTFVAVADAGQFSGAAADLGVSQQAVSKRVATLEKELGVALFARIPRGAELTVDGQAFLPHARDLLRAEERAAASVRADRRALRVDVISRRIAPARLLQGFHEAHPDTPLEVVRLFDARAAIEGVRTGAVDVSFRAVTRPARELPAGVVTAWVLDEPVHLLVGPQHALAARDAVTLSELAGHPIWMPALDPGTEWTTFYDDLAAAFGLRIDVTGPGFGTEPLLDVIAGHPELATLLGEQTHLIWPDGFGLRRIPLRDPVPAYPHSLIWRADNAHPALRALRQHLARTRRDRAAGLWVPEWARLLYNKMIMAMQWANCDRSGNSGANSRRVAAAGTCGGRDGHDHGPVAATRAVWPMIMEYGRCGDQAATVHPAQTWVRARSRSARRFTARRSSSLRPPHTPESWPDSMAQCRHGCITGQR
jgi:DNA-binding transcriptional LysR family regulator